MDQSKLNNYLECLDKESIDTYEIQDIHALNTFINNNNIVLNILHTNIRSASKNFDEFQLLLNEISHNIDILILTETWTISDVNYFSIKGYKTYFNESHYNQNDGVLIFIKDSLSHTMEVIKCDFELNYNIIRLNIKLKYNNLSISAIYKSPSISEQNFIKFLSDYINNRCKSITEIIVGDININILNNNDNNSLEYLDLMYSSGFRSYINKPTREKSCLDHIFVKNNSSLFSKIQPAILDTLITDHNPVYLQIIDSAIKTLQPKINYIKKIITNYKKLKEKLSTYDWSSLLNDNIDLSLDTFISKIKLEVNKASFTKILKPCQKKRKPWVSNGLIRSINIRDLLYKQTKLYPKNIKIKDTYTKYRKMIPKLVKAAKVQYFQKTINNAQNDPKKIWQIANESLNNINKNPEVSNICIEGCTIKNRDKIANTFNDFFVNIGSTLAKKFKNDKKQQNFFFNDIRTNHNSLFLNPTTPDEVDSIIKSLNNSASSGTDYLNTNMIKEISSEISIPFSDIVNRCLMEGYFPNILKSAQVHPVHKKGPKDCINNYRPISIISCLSKVFEKILHKRLLNFLEFNKIIHKNQYGFVKNKSTEDAIAFLSENIYSSFDRSKPCLAIFLDLTKAFDTVIHNILLDKLEKIGVRGVAHKMFTSYLNKRTQVVKLKNHVSESLPVECGVPQGTILGPLLFILYMNDLLYNKNIKNKIFSYADDTVLVVEGTNWDEVRSMAEHDFNVIKKWMDTNCLTINYDKTFFIPFSINRLTQPPIEVIKVHENNCNNNNCTCNITIKKTDTIKYLGVTIDKHFKWDKHIQSITCRLRRTLFIFKKLRDIMPQKNLLVFYYSLVQSILSYGIIGWGGAAESHLSRLNIIQKIIIKIIYNKNIRYPSEQVFTETKLLTIKQLYLISIIKLSTKYNNEFSINIVDHTYNTRFKGQAHTPIIKKTSAQRCFTYFMPKVYNKFNKYVIDNIPNLTKSNLNKYVKIWVKGLKHVEIKELFT